MTDLMKKYKVTFTYEEEVERILEHLGSDATVEEITQ